jgi:predicted transcriptional regulator
MNDRASSPNSSSVGALEASVLDALWAGSDLSTPEVHQRVGQPRGLAYTTILTVLQRLYRKGLVTRTEHGKAHVYSAAISRDQFAERRGQFLAGALVELGPAGVTAFLSEAGRLDPDIVALIRRQIQGAS